MVTRGKVKCCLKDEPLNKPLEFHRAKRYGFLAAALAHWFLSRVLSGPRFLFGVPSLPLFIITREPLVQTEPRGNSISRANEIPRDRVAEKLVTVLWSLSLSLLLYFITWNNDPCRYFIARPIIVFLVSRSCSRSRLTYLIDIAWKTCWWICTQFSRKRKRWKEQECHTTSIRVVLTCFSYRFYLISIFFVSPNE